MTIEEYLKLNNKPNTITGARTSKEFLNKEFEHIHRAMKLRPYITKDNHILYHASLPSSSVKYVVYDIVIDVDINGITDQAVDVTTLPCRFFSNSPSFTYHYAELFNRKDMYCEWLSDKHGPEILKRKAEVNNPDDQIYPERSLYLACKMIVRGKKNKLSTIRLTARHTKSNKSLLSVVQAYTYIATLREVRQKEGDANKVSSNIKKTIPRIAKREEKKYDGETKFTTKTRKVKKTGNTPRIRRFG
jgi:hypothetical protein